MTVENVKNISDFYVKKFILDLHNRFYDIMTDVTDFIHINSTKSSTKLLKKKRNK